LFSGLANGGRKDSSASLSLGSAAFNGGGGRAGEVSSGRVEIP
jgi:hypothetical protein